MNDPPLFLYESQFQWNSEKRDPGLAGKFKLGGWRHFGTFEDERFDTTGLSLANPASMATPAPIAGDYGVYAVFEQKLLRIGDDVDRGIGVFARASYSPPNQNLIDYYADAGLELVGLQDARPHDKFGVAVAYAHISPRPQALDGFSVVVRTGMASTNVGGCSYRGVSIRSAGRSDVAAERPVHSASGWWRDQSDR